VSTRRERKQALGRSQQGRRRLHKADKVSCALEPPGHPGPCLA